MNGSLKLLAVFPHPDDETLGLGPTLARYAAEGIETYLVCATRGERGWFDSEGPDLAWKESPESVKRSCAVPLNTWESMK
jgi:LmbE family N-acetylglucosaminyl deacetylase